MAEVGTTQGTVYVVDDDASMRAALERLFRANALAVETFASPAVFLAQAVDRLPCCAVLDYRMPGLDGIAVQERLQALGRTLPVVFITADGDVPTSVRAMKRGAVDFIEKPFDGEELLAAVRRALDASMVQVRANAQKEVLQRRLATLTAREHEVFALVAQGLLNKVIAARLGAAEKTIKVHRGRVMEKLGAASLAELVRMADRLGS